MYLYPSYRLHALKWAARISGTCCETPSKFSPLDIYHALQPTGIRFPCVEHLFQFSLSQLWTLLSLPWHAGCVPGVSCTGLESCHTPLARSGSLCTPSTRLPACPGGFGWWPARRLIPLCRCHLGWSPVQHTKKIYQKYFFSWNTLEHYFPD